MKKRKIRYDRILLPILILCVIIFGISSCHKTEETKIQSKPIHTTTDFLKNALKPVGQTLYIYGGGWNEAQTGSGTEALTLAYLRNGNPSMIHKIVHIIMKTICMKSIKDLIVQAMSVGLSTIL